MFYTSTRGRAPSIPFRDVLTAGLAPDGGLYVPEELPRVDAATLKSWKYLSYAELVEKVIAPFVDDAMPISTLRECIEKAYAHFDHPEIAPLTSLSKFEKNMHMLELYHGPTLAFKDFALQLFGHLLHEALKGKKKKKAVVLGATSGDTGSAAIAGLVNTPEVEVFMLHPHGRVTDIQRRQMTTVDAPHIHNIAIEGTFDDCQALVKQLYLEADFLPRDKYFLISVNSINWARIMVQIVYYLHAYLKLGAPEKGISFAVPTGNFGNIYAGWLAYRMGVPVHQFVVATNRNDILSRFFNHNDYSQDSVVASLSPSMDIQVSSNFERLVYDLLDRNGEKTRALFETFSKTGKLKVPEEAFAKAREKFVSYAVDDLTTLRTMRQVFEMTDILPDPHTAVGIEAARKMNQRADIPMVVLSTAHPAKFRQACLEAVNHAAPLPLSMQPMMQNKEIFDILPNQKKALRGYIEKHI